jgi:DNA modification methylase
MFLTLPNLLFFRSFTLFTFQRSCFFLFVIKKCDSGRNFIDRVWGWCYSAGSVNAHLRFYGLRNGDNSMIYKKLSKKRRVFASPQINDLTVLNKLKFLKKLIHEQDNACWEIGDLCMQLIDKFKLSLRQIANSVGYSRARISHFHLTARTFPVEQRESFTFQDSLTARQVYIKFPRLNMSPYEIRDIVIKLHNKTPYQVRSYFIHLLTHQEQNQHLAESAQSYLYNKDRIINHCHCADWRTIIPQLENGSVQLFLCDPPYGSYTSRRYDTNCLRIDSDNNDSIEEALETTLPLFELCLPKLKPQGILILFQAGGQPDRPEILLKAQEWGWDCVYALNWSKGSLSTGNFQNPYRVCTERILVFCRKGESPQRFQDGNCCPDILDFPPMTNSVISKMRRGKMPYADYHMFQKPLELMDFLIKHHSYGGDLIVEPFGCSGSGCIGASKLNRQWVYIESNQNNYLWGSERVYKAISEMQLEVG